MAGPLGVLPAPQIAPPRFPEGLLGGLRESARSVRGRRSGLELARRVPRVTFDSMTVKPGQVWRETVGRERDWGWTVTWLVVEVYDDGRWSRDGSRMVYVGSNATVMGVMLSETGPLGEEEVKVQGEASCVGFAAWMERGSRPSGAVGSDDESGAEDLGRTTYERLL